MVSSDEKLRVLMINHFPLEGSGSGTYTKNLATQLVERGHNVCVIMPETRSDFPRYEGVRLHPVYFTADSDAHGALPESALPFNFPCFTTHPQSTTTFDVYPQTRFICILMRFAAPSSKRWPSSNPTSFMVSMFGCCPHWHRKQTCHWCLQHTEPT